MADPLLDADALRAAAFAAVAAQPSLPLPGGGQTLARWQALADIGARDVCLAKILEAHYDAAAILQALGHAAPAPGELWAVWAAEPPGAVAVLTRDGDGLRLGGSKAWCSGADVVTHALITAQDGEDKALVALDIARPGVSDPARAWPAVGMSRVVSGELRFSGAPVRLIGEAGAYLDRPGFWHGGAGIAACWFGATAAIAEPLRAGVRASPHALALLGRIDMDLGGAAALLRELAARIDDDPAAPHVREVVRVRSVMERACAATLDRVARALGPGPLCADAGHAHRCADLAVFIRQSHAERDWEQLGAAAREGTGWTLTGP